MVNEVNKGVDRAFDDEIQWLLIEVSDDYELIGFDENYADEDDENYEENDDEQAENF